MFGTYAKAWLCCAVPHLSKAGLYFACHLIDLCSAELAPRTSTSLLHLIATSLHKHQQALQEHGGEVDFLTSGWTSHTCTLHRCRCIVGITAAACAEARQAVHANLPAGPFVLRASGRLCVQVEMVLHIEKEAGAHKKVIAASLLHEALACEAAQTAGPCYAYA